MSWLEPAALGLLGALLVLAWLVLLQRGAKRVEAGTLFIWRRVAARRDARRRRPRFEPLLWVSAAAVIAGALAAARPALAQAGGERRVAVFIERLGPTGG